MCEKEFDHLFKIVIIGDQAVGKSSILLRFTEERFTDQYLNTIGVDFKLKTVKIDDRIVKLQLWDTAGAECFQSLTSAYYRGSHGIVFVFSVTNYDSFKNLSYWFKEVDRNAGVKNRRLLVGNKIDLRNDRVVSTEEAQAFAESKNMQYIETSAKTSENVEEAFLTLADDIILLFPESKKPSETIDLSKSRQVTESWMSCGSC